MYSLPVIIKGAIERRLEDHLADIFPYAFCPILVTSSELRMLNKDFSIDEVKNAETIDEISTEIPYLNFNTYSYPSFIKHTKNIFEELKIDENRERIDYFNEIRILKVDNFDGIKYDDPILEIHPTINLLNNLKRGGSGLFRDVIICNLKNLPTLLDKIKDYTNLVGNKIETIGDKKAKYLNEIKERKL